MIDGNWRGIAITQADSLPPDSNCNHGTTSTVLQPRHYKIVLLFIYYNIFIFLFYFLHLMILFISYSVNLKCTHICGWFKHIVDGGGNMVIGLNSLVSVHYHIILPKDHDKVVMGKWSLGCYSTCKVLKGT